MQDGALSVNNEVDCGARKSPMLVMLVMSAVDCWLLDLGLACHSSGAGQVGETIQTMYDRGTLVIKTHTASL